MLDYVSNSSAIWGMRIPYFKSIGRQYPASTVLNDAKGLSMASSNRVAKENEEEEHSMSEDVQALTAADNELTAPIQHAIEVSVRSLEESLGRFP
jgi:peptidoglycan hydrolase-like amidase